MAGVLDALASYVTNMLTEMAKEEVAILIGVSGEIDKLGVKLTDLKNFLADADRRNITDESVRGWVDELKRAMYHATDILDLCKLKVMEQSPSRDMGCLNPLLFCMRNPLHAHDIGSRIKELNQRFLEHKSTCGDTWSIWGVIPQIDSPRGPPPCSRAVPRRRSPSPSLPPRRAAPLPSSAPAPASIRRRRPLAVPPRRSRSSTSFPFPVGTSSPSAPRHRHHLIAVTTSAHSSAGDNTDPPMVVAIVGVGGIGKTTLAKKVFNDEAIEAIIGAGGDLPGSGMAQDRALLAIALRNAIKDKKFFLILDDMWGVDAWDKLLMRPFSYYGAPGSRVLITTRNDTVAQDMRAVQPYHHVDKLDSKDAWSLLKKQYLSVEGCEGFEKLPDSIVELRELRHLDIDGTHVDSIPSGFGVLTNLKGLCGFPAYIDGDWCSLEELGPLSELKELGLEGLENVSATLSVAKARLIAKKHLNKLALSSNIRVGNNGLVVEGVSEEKQKIIEVVFDELCPPPCLEYLVIKGYFGRQLPRWMMWTGTVPLENLRALFMFDLACCTRLPDGLCRLPFLEYLDLHRAPAIKRVGPEFVQPYNDRHHASSQAVAAFPKLQKIALVGMVEWEEWEWKVEVQAMPVLEEFLIRDCKLSCIPPGLAFHARSLKKITIWNVKGLRSLENFASVVELNLFGIPYLTRISNFPKLQYLGIILCPKLEVLQEMSALRRLVLTFLYEERLPMYLQTVNPCHLQLDYSSPELLASMAAGKPGPEWDKFSHIQRVEAYAGIGFFENKWQLFYTRDPYSIEINSDLQEWIECEELEDDADVDNNQDENEEERKGHDLQERPDEPLPSGSGGLFRSGDDDEEDLNNNQGKSEN
ncbi:unnamed protein product [Alopecurus aequalis]